MIGQDSFQRAAYLNCVSCRPTQLSVADTNVSTLSPAACYQFQLCRNELTTAASLSIQFWDVPAGADTKAAAADLLSMLLFI